MTTTTKQLSRKQVRETVYGKGISAWVILNPQGEHVATVQAAFLDSGNVMVDVWDKHTLTFQGRAGGYGYDKLNAAIAGAVIDGHTIYSHSSGISSYQYDEFNNRYPELQEIMKQYLACGEEDVFIKSSLKAIGARFANWKQGETGKGGHYTSLYYESGLDRLTSLGYKVIQAI